MSNPANDAGVDSQSHLGLGIWWTSVSIRLDQPDCRSRLLGETAHEPASSIGRELRHSRNLAGNLTDKFSANEHVLQGLLEREETRRDFDPIELSPFIKRYELDWEKAPCFDPDPNSGIKENPWLLAREIRIRRDEKRHRFDNEFLIRSRGDQEPCDIPLYRAQHQLAQVLAMRRSMLFSPSLALHTFTVLLPPGRLTEEIEEGSKGTKKRLDYLAFPVTHFLRLPHAPHFRRTFSLSLLLIPVDGSERLRGMESETQQITTELRRITRSESEATLESDQGGKYTLGGPLEKFLTSEMSGERQSIRVWLEEILYAVVFRVIDREDKFRDEVFRARLRDAVFRAVRVSRYSGFAGVLEGHTADDLAGPAEQTEATVHSWIERLLGKDFAIYHPHLRRLEYGYLTLVDPPSRLSIWPFARDPGDPGGDYSKFFSELGWGVFDSVGLSALQEMLSVFHHQIEGQPDFAATRGSMKSFIGDVEEYFDFDLMPDYRAHFETLKEAVGIDKAFERLRQKLESLERQKIVEEQGNTNAVLVVFAVVGAVGTLLAIIDSLDKAYSVLLLLPQLEVIRLILAAIMLVLLGWAIWFSTRRSWSKLLRSFDRLLSRRMRP